MAAPLVRTILSTARLSSPRKHFKNRSDPLKSTYFISRLFSSNDTDATEPKAERPETHFGFESVPEEEKENKGRPSSSSCPPPLPSSRSLDLDLSLLLYSIYY